MRRSCLPRFPLALALCAATAHAAPLPPAGAPAAEATLEPVPDSPPSSAPPMAARDAALVRALLSLFDPWGTSDDRLRAFDAPALADPRAAPAVSFLLADPRPEIRAAAASALAQFPDNPRVEAALIRTVRERQERTEVRVAAVQALARVGAAPAGEALVALTEDDREDLALRNAARTALEARFPELAARRGATEVVDRSGRFLLVSGGALLGAYALGAVGGLGRNDAGITIGILGGALVGAGTAFFLTRTGEITPAQAGWMVSAGIWGAGAGMLTAGIATADPSTRLTLALGLLGEGAALTAATLTRRSMPYRGGEVTFINFAGLTGLDLVGGALLMSEGGNAQLGRAVLLGGGLLGLGVGGLLARRLEFEDSDVALTTHTAYEGLATGFLAAKAFDASDQRTGGASLLGLGAGFAGGVALAQVTSYGSDDVKLLFVMGSYGKLLGVSIPMLANAGDPMLATGALAGSVAALGGAHLLRQKLSFDGGGVSFVALSTAVGFWHGLALGRADESLTSRQQMGAMALGAALGGAVAMPLAQVITPTSTQVLALTGGAFWGTWFAAWSVALADVAAPTGLRLTLAASDVGLATAALLVSPLLDVDARRIGVANLGGLAGAGLASLAAALATRNNDAVITANLIGSGAGLIGGAIVASSLTLSPLPADAAASPTASARGTWGHTWGKIAAGIAPPQLVPLIVPDHRRGGGATTMGLGLAFAEARERMRPLSP